MAIIDDFPAIKAAMERSKPADSKHPLLMDAVVLQRKQQMIGAWRNVTSPDGTKWYFVPDDKVFELPLVPITHK